MSGNVRTVDDGREIARARAASLGAIALLMTAALAVSAEDYGRGPVGVPPALDPATNARNDAKVELGETLFADKRLSVDNDLACATCHVASLAFTDGRARAIGRGGKELTRNAPTLLNVAHVRDLFHDGRAASLEEQIRAVAMAEDEFGWTSATAFAERVASVPGYPAMFEKAFGDRTITLQRTARAIAAYERTLLAGDSPFDTWWNGDDAALTDEQQRGYDLFVGPADVGSATRYDRATQRSPTGGSTTRGPVWSERWTRDAPW